MPIARSHREGRVLLVPGQEVLMSEDTMPTNRSHQVEPTDAEQAVPQAPQDQAGLSDLQVLQAGSSPKRTALGRKPLFGT